MIASRFGLSIKLIDAGERNTVKLLTLKRIQ